MGAQAHLLKKNKGKAKHEMFLILNKYKRNTSHCSTITTISNDSFKI
jgi:hypothetical protein